MQNKSIQKVQMVCSQFRNNPLVINLLATLSICMALPFPLSAQVQDTVKKPESIIAHELAKDANAENIRNTLTPLLIARFGGGAGALAQRVAGVNVSGGYVSVRGLSPRYSTFFYDNLSAGVTEQNIKTFSLQFIPGGVLNDLTIHKSGVARNPGEYAGAVIESHSKTTPPKDFDVISFGLGYRVNTTFKDFYVDPDYNSTFGSFFGFGGKERSFLDDVSSYQDIQAMTRNETAEEAKKLRNNYYVEKKKALPDFSMAYTMGRNFKMKKESSSLSTINLISYGRAYANTFWNRFAYANYEKGDNNIVETAPNVRAITDAVHVLPSQLALMSNWEYRLNKRNTIKFTNLFTQIGAEITLMRYSLNYERKRETIGASVGQEARTNYLGRLNGEHFLGEKGKLDWAFGYNYGFREDPNLRRFGGNRSYADSGAQFLYIVPEGSKADNGARFGSKQNDNTVTGRLDYTWGNEQSLMIRGGVLGEFAKRDFQSRLLTFAQDGLTRPELLFQPFDKETIKTIFEPVNFGPDGYFMVDGTTAGDNYKSSYDLVSGYADATKTILEGFTVNLGLRIEDFKQNLKADTSVDNNSTDVMPFVNIKYQLTENMDIRLGYNKSVNRPAFRELAPFSFYDYDFRADVQGNPGLQNAQINNLDAKWEWYIGEADYLSFGGFFKEFKNPIEMYYVIRSELPLFTFQNSEKAKVAGLEFELKKTLSKIKGSALNDMALYLNAAYIRSNIELGETSVEAVKNRPLQGQAPYVINLAYIYSKPAKGVKFELIYNISGKSLYSTGDGQETYPWYLMPRHMLDLNFNKAISKRWSLSLGVSNLLDTPLEIREDANLDQNVSNLGGADNVIQKGYQSQRISLGVNFRIR
jgi:TonB-dependent receptor